MKSYTLKKIGKTIFLSEVEFEAVSWFATDVFNQKDNNNPSQYELGRTAGKESVLSFLNIKEIDFITYDIKFNHNFTGLRNFNKLETVEYFD